MTMLPKEKTLKIRFTGFSPRQREIALSWKDSTEEEYYHILLASRKSGKTFLMSRLLAFTALKNSNSLIGFFTYSARMKTSFYNLLIKCIPEQITVKSSEDTIILKNGTIIYLYSASSPHTPVNESFNFIFADEFALWRKNVWDYLTPTLIATNGKAFISSTPRGKNAFYDLVKAGENKDPHTVLYKMKWTDNLKPDGTLRIKPERIEAERAKMHPKLFLQEYDCQFVDAISDIFGDFSNCLTVDKWDLTPKVNLNYFAAIDVAGAGSDETVLTIIDQNGKVCFILALDDKNLVIQASKIEPYLKMFNCPTYVEKNGIGQGLLDILTSKGCNCIAFNTTSNNKKEMVDNLAVRINKGEIQLPTRELCYELSQELSAFHGKVDGKKTTYEGYDEHDDYVMSLLIANWARRNIQVDIRFTSQKVNDSEVLDTWLQKAFLDAKPKWYDKIDYKRRF